MRSKSLYTFFCLPSLILLPACATTAGHQVAATNNHTSNSTFVASKTANSQIAPTYLGQNASWQNATYNARPADLQTSARNAPFRQQQAPSFDSAARRTQKTGYAMGMGPTDDAPAGLGDFCARSPAFCTVATNARQQRFRPAQPQPGFMLTSYTTIPTNNFNADFSTIETSRQQIQPMTWSPQSRQLVNRINRQVNSAMVGTTDRLAFGREEYWTMPLSQPDRPRGRARPLADCEDFALEKRQALVSAGIPETALYLAVAANERIGLHAVLMVSTDQGDFVLDNLTDWVLPWSDTQYVWIKRQSTTSMLDWVMAGGRVSPDEAGRRPSIFESNPFILAHSNVSTMPSSMTTQMPETRSQEVAELATISVFETAQKSTKTQASLGLRGFAQDSGFSFVPSGQATSAIRLSSLQLKSLRKPVTVVKVPQAQVSLSQKAFTLDYKIVDPKERQSVSKTASLGDLPPKATKRADVWEMSLEALVWDFR
jgi:predicted transglutaminase-like cysteine proteinase